MKKLLLLTILLTIFALSGKAQTVECPPDMVKRSAVLVKDSLCEYPKIFGQLYADI